MTLQRTEPNFCARRGIGPKVREQLGHTANVGGLPPLRFGGIANRRWGDEGDFGMNTDSLLPGEPGPTFGDDVAVERVEFHQVRLPLQLFRRDEGAARSA